MKFNIQVAASFFIACSFLATTPAAAQVLKDAVAAAGNSTALQVTTAAAVQATCGALVQLGTAVQAGSAQDDLKSRCGEMVGTGADLEGAASTLPSFNWSNNELAASMQQLSGEEQASQGRLATDTSNGQFANIGMRLDAIRTGARATAGGINLALQGVPVIGGNAGEGDVESSWGWFANGALGFGDHDSTSRENDYDYDSYGATLGVDYLFNSGLVLGLAVSVSDFEVDFDQSGNSSNRDLTRTVTGGKTELDGWGLTPYAVYTLGRFHIDGTFTYGENDVDTKRVVQYDASASSGLADQNRTMKGDTDSETLAAGASIGTYFDFGGTTLYTDFGLSYLDIDIDSYEELDPTTNGGLNLGFQNQSIDSFQSILGAELTHAFSTSVGVVVPYLRGEWRHEFENESETIKTYYAAYRDTESWDDNPLFLNVETDDPDEDFFELGVGVSALFAGNIQAYLDYRTTLGLDDVSANLFTIGVRGSF
jgi:outer membrane lipase/esterase